MTSKPQITARVGDGENVVTRTAKGRDAWALAELLQAGERGVTPIERPAPRWSHYVYKLRGFGFAIETNDEPHGGPYAGSHARYVLRSPVEVVERVAI